MRIFAVIICVFALTGCVSAVLSGATSTVTTVAQERSVGEAVDDLGILIEIKHFYTQTDVNDLLYNVGVHVNEGRVLLTGAVNLPFTSMEAVRLAWQAKGVREVINEIQVDDQDNIVDYAKDIAIETQIKTRALFAQGVMSINYTFEVVNGVAYVFGIAQDKTELDKVLYIASTTQGVSQVVSHVRMKDDITRQGL